MDAPVGRDVERETIARFVAVAAERPAVLAIEGEAGIGKSTLFRHAVALAVASGATVLRMSPTEAEAALTFAGLTDLLGGIPASDLEGLPGPQRDALEVATLWRDPGEGGVDQRAIGTGLRTLLSSAARRGPLVVAVDDVQWLDAPSRSALEFALRRIDAPVGVLTCRRVPTDQPDLTDAAPPDAWRATCPVRSLSIGATFLLVRQHLGVELPRLRLRRVWEASAGNPLFALELVRAGAADDPTGIRAPVPSRLQGLLHSRLGSLSDAARDTLLVAACASRPQLGTLRRLGAAQGLGEAEQAGIVEVVNGRVGFTHPLLREAVVDLAPAEARRAVHARLADEAEGSEERARHLALAASRPSEETAAALDEAAAAAEQRGAVSAAVELAGLALEHTEAATVTDRAALWRRRITLARLLFAGGETSAARDVLADRADGCPPGTLRAEAELLMTEIAFQTGADANAAARLAIEHASDQPLLLARALLAASIVSASIAESAELAVRARACLEASAVDDQLLLAWAMVQVASGELALGHGLDAERIRQALAVERRGRTWRSSDQVATTAPVLLKWIDEHDASLAALDELRRRAEEEGNEGVLPYVLGHRPGVLIRLGRFEEAHRCALEHLAAAEATQQDGQRMQALYNVACALAFRGDLDAATRAGEEFLRAAVEIDDPWTIAAGSGILGFVELSRRDVPAARRLLDDWHRAAARAGIIDPGVSRYHHDHVEALVGDGDVDAARGRTAELTAIAERAGRPSAQALAARCRALVHAHDGDLDAALVEIDRSLALDDRSPVPFERARTLLLRGVVLRRRKEKAAAREALEDARARFVGLGAGAWAERAAEELDRLGRRAVRQDELTSTERRVAELAASGLTNRQVAEQAFMSPKTVEANLAKVYRKLGITSRAELGARMTALAQAER